MSTFVLVHGAWHGGWCWRMVREILEKNHHLVYTPTMTGLGERSHLMSRNITMETVIEDVVNVIKFENLEDVILVGHSFAGTVISGVAEIIPERIQQLVYLDAALLEDGESMFGCMNPDIVAERKKLANETSNGISLPTPAAKCLGILDEKQWKFVEGYLTPQPVSTYASSIRLNSAPGDGFPCSYIVCVNPIYESLAWARERLQGYDWPVISLDTGHDAMVSDPEALSNILLSLND